MTRSPSKVPGIVAVAAGVFLLAFGIWAMAAPRSFFDAVALFEPYNQHFLQDIGAFQIGLGAVLLLPEWRPASDGLAVALLGVGIGGAAHTVSHVIGIELGGRPGSDIPLFTVLTVALLWAGIMRWREQPAAD
jgi:hypothetical protein